MKIDNGICPNCGRDNLNYSACYPQETDMIYPFECLDCKQIGEEVYQMGFVGMHLSGEFHSKTETRLTACVRDSGCYRPESEDRMEHTKGEWEAVPCNGLSGWRICIENGTHQICGIKPSDSASGLLSKEEHLANARLIAAAPELLAACKLVFENLEPLYASEHICIKKLKAAIAKAKG